VNAVSCLSATYFSYFLQLVGPPVPILCGFVKDFAGERQVLRHTVTATALHTTKMPDLPTARHHLFSTNLTLHGYTAARTYLQTRATGDAPYALFCCARALFHFRQAFRHGRTSATRAGHDALDAFGQDGMAGSAATADGFLHLTQYLF